MASLFFVGCGPQSNTQQLKDEYRKKLSSTKDLMITTSILSVDLCSKHSEAWRAATRDSYGSIKLAVLESLKSHKESVESIVAGELAVELMMPDLNSPPEGFGAAHSKIISVYGSFKSLVSVALSPSGSLISYNQNVNRIQEDFMGGVNELKVLIP